MFAPLISLGTSSPCALGQERGQCVIADKWRWIRSSPLRTSCEMLPVPISGLTPNASHTTSVTEAVCSQWMLPGGACRHTWCLYMCLVVLKKASFLYVFVLPSKKISFCFISFVLKVALGYAGLCAVYLISRLCKRGWTQAVAAMWCTITEKPNTGDVI